MARLAPIRRPEDTAREFAEAVFPAELEEIRARRAVSGIATGPLDTGPAVPSADLGLIGLALSGGGIRSASFSLGVVQELARAGLLPLVDYLSTVSGGGYLGSCLSSLFAEPAGVDGPGMTADTFPLQKPLGAEEPPALRHLRNGSSYLNHGGLLESVRLPVVVLRGVLLNVMFFIPVLMLAVFLTAVVYEIEPLYRLELQLEGLLGPWVRGVLALLPVILALAPLALLIATWPFVLRFTRVGQSWRDRNVHELLLTRAVLMAIGILMLIPVSRVVGWAVDAGGSRITGSGVNPWNYSPRVLGAIGVTVLAVLILRVASRAVAVMLGTLGTWLLALSGPMLIVGTYLLLCVWLITPSHPVPPGEEAHVRQLLVAGQVDSVVQRVAGVPASERVVLHHDRPDRWDLEVIRPGFHVTTMGRVFTIWENPDDQDRLYVTPALVQGKHLVLLAIAAVAFLVNLLFLSVNETSPHAFYRDRLSRVFLIRLWKGRVEENDTQKLSDLAKPGSVAPLHLLNATLNLKGSDDQHLRGRNGDFFVFSKRFTGSERTGWVPTPQVEALDRRLDLGTALAISAAAAAPNMGTATLGSLTFLMTLLNVRLGYWLPNPTYVAAGKTARLAWTGAGLRYLVREALGMTDAQLPYLNVSDGGHLENLGVYELIRRRCAFIVAVDGECDPSMSCSSLATLIRYARIDLGVDVTVDLAPLRLDAQRHTRGHWALGRLDYGNGEVGTLLYIKAAMTGDEPEDLSLYRTHRPEFPHQTTADQFFDETKMEVYRALGAHSAISAIRAIEGEPLLARLSGTRDAA